MRGAKFRKRWHVLCEAVGFIRGYCAVRWELSFVHFERHTPQSILSGPILICGSTKETPSGTPGAQCPRDPAQAGSLQSLLSILLPPHPTHRRWILNPLRRNTAGSVYPIPPRAHFDARSWKSWTACEPPGRLNRLSCHCDMFPLPSRVGADMDLPMIAVIGSQSAGKSSLIEAISGITLPRAAGTCTR